MILIIIVSLMDPIEMEVLRQAEQYLYEEEIRFMEEALKRYILVDQVEVPEEDMKESEILTWKQAAMVPEESRPKHLIRTYTSGFK